MRRLITHGLLLAMLAGLLYLGAEWLGTGQAGGVPQEAAPVGAPQQPKPTAVSTGSSGRVPLEATSPAPSPVVAVPSPGATPPAAVPTPVARPLAEEIGDYVAGLDGTYGVAISNSADGQRVLIDAGRVFPSASLYKVLVMYRVFQSIHRGDLSPDDEVEYVAGDLVEAEDGDGISPGDAITVGEALERMIAFSSNPDAYLLARQVGSWNGVLATARELGMTDTTWDGESFVTTPADMLLFFEALGRRSLISPEASDQMIELLLRQRINDRLPAGLPEGTKVAHKTGELPYVRHDAGLVFTDRGHYAIVIMSQGIDPPKAAVAQAEISRMAFERFGG